MNGKSRKYLQILALSVSGSSIYLLPYIKYVFYDQQMAAMGATNQQVGFLVSAYAIGCMILYIPGGIIADKISAKKGIIASLLSTAILTVIYGFTLNYTMAVIIWFLMAFTTTFIFWTALMKSIRLIGDDDEQGRMYGFYYAGYGVMGAIINGISIWASSLSENPRTSLLYVTFIYALANILAAILVFVLIKENKKEDKQQSAVKENKFDLSQVGALLKSPTVWVFSLVIFAGYSLHSSSSYFTPYLTDVKGVSAGYSSVISVIRTYVFMLLAPFGGYMADKVLKSTSKWFILAFSLLVIFYVSVIFLPSNTSVLLASIISLLPGALALMLYGILFSIVGETKIPIGVTATAIGIASIIGYSPDLFLASTFGKWLDVYGNGGYTRIFIALACIGTVGIIGSYYIRLKSKNLTSENE